MDLPQRLEDLGADMPPSHLAVVAASDDATQLWATWGGLGWGRHCAEDRRAPYRPGQRSPDWLKVKQRQRHAVHVEAGDFGAGAVGDWGWAVRLTLSYTHPHTGEAMRIEEIVRVPQPETFTLHVGSAGTVQC